HPLGKIRGAFPGVREQDANVLPEDPSAPRPKAGITVEEGGWLRDDDASALEGPFLELVEDVVDFVELALLRNHSNLSLTGQLHQLPELVPIADEAPEDGEFGEDYIDGFHAQRPAIADDDQGPALVKHLH